MALPILSQTEGPAHPGGRVGRLLRYALRVSVLEQCPYHCPYCMPGAVTAPVERARWLGAADYARLGTLFAARGVVKVRLTGGEPLLRDDLVDVTRALSQAMPGVELALTTNGQRVTSSRLNALADAGLTRLTVHLDTLRDDRYARLMGNSTPGAIVDVIDLVRARLGEAKLNMVVQRGQNDDELVEFLDFAQRHDVQVRFIELMNTGSADAYTRASFVAGRDIMASIAAVRGAVPIARRHASDPAALYRTDDGVTFGVIASDTEPFCADCDRLRLTADGRLRGCLYQHGGIPLGAALQSGASDETLAALLDQGLDDKASHHPLHAPSRQPFSMADVGG
jgi:cyclic pyranopterin phosphate synthase